MIQIFSILEKYEFPKKLFFRYLQNIWDNLDGQKIPAFVLKDDDGKRSFLDTLEKANPFVKSLVSLWRFHFWKLSNLYPTSLFTFPK